MHEATYQVRISGTIPAELMVELADLTVTVEPPETVLHGSLPDQSAVVGLISRIHGLGLRLIEVRRLQPDEPGAPGPVRPTTSFAGDDANGSYGTVAAETALATFSHRLRQYVSPLRLGSSPLSIRRNASRFRMIGRESKAEIVA